MQTVVQLNAPANTPVFTLLARDPDSDSNIHFFIVRDRTGGRFEVDERSGVVRTRGSDPFQLDMEYVLYVKAEDQVCSLIAFCFCGLRGYLNAGVLSIGTYSYICILPVLPIN